MEIGSGGSLKVYDRPMVFNADGATPIEPARKPRTGRAAPASEPAGLRDAADAAELSPALVAAVAWRESGFRPQAVSRAGALGEMQLMPATARALGVDARDPRQNLGGGATYLHAMMRRYDGDLMRALAAYNAGPKAVDRYGGVPPFKETQAYVAAILDRLSGEVAGVAVNGSAK